jgi:hypothetical protein
MECSSQPDLEGLAPLVSSERPSSQSDSEGPPPLGSDFDDGESDSEGPPPLASDSDDDVESCGDYWPSHGHGYNLCDARGCADKRHVIDELRWYVPPLETDSDDDDDVELCGDYSSSYGYHREFSSLYPDADVFRRSIRSAAEFAQYINLVDLCEEID